MAEKKELATKAVKEVSIIKGATKKFLTRWAVENEETFAEVMAKLADERPERFADIYIKVLDKTDMFQQPNGPLATNLNVQFNKIDALGDVKDSSWRTNTDNAQYEEIKD